MQPCVCVCVWGVYQVGAKWREERWWFQAGSRRVLGRSDGDVGWVAVILLQCSTNTSMHLLALHAVCDAPSDSETSALSAHLQRCC